MGFFLACLGIQLYQLCYAWVYRVVYVPRWIKGWVSYDNDPIWFLGVVVFLVFSSIVCAVIVMLIVHESLAENRSFQRRRSQPPLDNAIRVTADRSI